MGKTVKPKKQRLAIYSGAAHTKAGQVSAHLSKELRKSTGMRAVPLKAGDKVMVMRGSYKKKSGKVTAIERGSGRVFIENITRKKSDGTEKQVPFRASNLMVTELERSDERRFKHAKKKVAGTAEGKKAESGKVAVKEAGAAPKAADGRAGKKDGRNRPKSGKGAPAKKLKAAGRGKKAKR